MADQLQHHENSDEDNSNLRNFQQVMSEVIDD